MSWSDPFSGEIWDSYEDFLNAGKEALEYLEKWERDVRNRIGEPVIYRYFTSVMFRAVHQNQYEFPKSHPMHPENQKKQLPSLQQMYERPYIIAFDEPCYDLKSAEKKACEAIMADGYIEPVIIRFKQFNKL